MAKERSAVNMRYEQRKTLGYEQDRSFVVAGVLTMFPGNLVSSVIWHLAQLCPGVSYITQSHIRSDQTQHQ